MLPNMQYSHFINFMAYNKLGPYHLQICQKKILEKKGEENKSFFLPHNMINDCTEFCIIMPINVGFCYREFPMFPKCRTHLADVT